MIVRKFYKLSQSGPAGKFCCIILDNWVMEGLIRAGCLDRVGPEPRTWVGRAQGLTGEGGLVKHRAMFPPSCFSEYRLSTDVFGCGCKFTCQNEKKRGLRKQKDRRDILSFIKIKINLALDINVFLK